MRCAQRAHHTFHDSDCEISQVSTEPIKALVLRSPPLYHNQSASPRNWGRGRPGLWLSCSAVFGTLWSDSELYPSSDHTTPQCAKSYAEKWLGGAVVGDDGIRYHFVIRRNFGVRHRFAPPFFSAAACRVSGPPKSRLRKSGRFPRSADRSSVVPPAAPPH